ncbi:unnamed protein product [Peronospora belbahrii]|uniref:Protein RFT1 homolog n=1 Tax=Peronospora belbahrii TaxID=622444 RepID=A0AAU9LC39_9STRA|nr:unnamed protein product [Peronospora belbahrii]
MVSDTLKDDETMTGYVTVLSMYCCAAMIEALAEPMYVLAHASVLVSWQVAAQSAAFLVRAVVQYMGVVMLELNLIAYGIAELSYAVTLLVMFMVLYWRRIYVLSSEKDKFALTTMTQLLPGKPDGNIDWYHAELMALMVPLTVQSGVKYLLAEGDKWVLTGFASLQAMGVAETEERSKNDKEINNKSRADGQTLLLVLLKLMNLVGLLFVCFGTSYAYTLAILLYGAEKARQGVGAALAVYCAYIPFLGVNGICEAVVHAIGNDYELMQLNKLLGVFFAIYALSALVFMQVLDWGTFGLILANCVNMGCRILYCLAFLASYFRQVACKRQTSNDFINGLSFWCQSLPDRLVVTAFVISLAVTLTSQHVLLNSETDSSLMFRHMVHVAVGALCFAGVVLILYVKEWYLLRAQLTALWGQGKSHDD